ncbi:hypothetical protein [Streptomyces sp. NPDC059753]|uniref:sodium:solute symporter family transporter n=1 Tax=Streptomyces sp. NPDC059753 TaxID=3346933 RepID=UPI00365406DC
MGGLVACFAAVADLKGTSRVQVAKVVVTLATFAVVTVLALRKFSWDSGRLLPAAVDRSVAPDGYLSPGLWAHISSLVPLNMISDHIVTILGTAAMPHLILRVSTSATGRSARRSVSIAAGLTGAYFLLVIATGFTAAAVEGGRGIGAVDANGQASTILLASGVLQNGSGARVALITVMACVAFLVVLTTVTSATFETAVPVTRDVFARADSSRDATQEVRTLRLAIVALGVVGLVLSAAAHRYPFRTPGLIAVPGGFPSRVARQQELARRPGSRIPARRIQAADGPGHRTILSGTDRSVRGRAAAFGLCPDAVPPSRRSEVPRAAVAVGVTWGRDVPRRPQA